MDSVKKNARHILIIRATPALLAITHVEIAQMAQKRIVPVAMIPTIFINQPAIKIIAPEKPIAFRIRLAMLVILAVGSALTFQRIIAPNV